MKLLFKESQIGHVGLSYIEFFQQLIFHVLSAVHIMYLILWIYTCNSKRFYNNAGYIHELAIIELVGPVYGNLSVVVC